MRRFDYDDNEEYRDDVDKFFDSDDDEVTPDEYKAMIAEEQEMQAAQIDLVHRDLNQRLLFRVTRMLEKSFLWRFKSLDARLDMIARTYRKLKKLEEDD